MSPEFLGISMYYVPRISRMHLCGRKEKSALKLNIALLFWLPNVGV